MCILKPHDLVTDSLRPSSSNCKLIRISKATSAELAIISCKWHDLSHMVTLSQLPLLYYYFHPSTIAFKLPLLLSVVIIEHPLTTVNKTSIITINSSSSIFEKKTFFCTIRGQLKIHLWNAQREVAGANSANPIMQINILA